MKRVAALVAGAVLVAAVGQAGAETADVPGAERLPEHPARETTIRACTACHTLEVVVDKRYDAATWYQTVQSMVDRGAMASPDEVVQITTYLAQAFPPEGAAPAAAAKPAKPAAATPAAAKPAASKPASSEPDYSQYEK